LSCVWRKRASHSSEIKNEASTSVEKQRGQIRREQFVFLMISQDLAPSLERPTYP